MKNIGINVKAPKEKCEDVNCPFHGNLRIKETLITGTIISSRMQKSATVEIPRTKYIPKYERYEKKMTRIKVHNPQCINAKEGDVVKIALCKPLSKTKTFVIVEKTGGHNIISEREEIYEGKESKKKHKETPKPAKQEEKSE